MAMQSGAMVVPEKIPVQWYSHQQQPLHHHMDEREGFLMWLRGEFAAANAIIDALCHHLRAVGQPGEYDNVIASVQQRRCNWNPILHMQQYFSVADVVYTLQQVAWERQQKVAGFDVGARIGGGGKEFRRGGRGERGGFEVQNSDGEMNGKDLISGNFKSSFKVNEKFDGVDNAKVEKKDEKEVAELNEKLEENSIATSQGSTQGAVAHADVKAKDTGSCSDGSGLVEQSNLKISPKTFVATEIFDGKSVNIAEGLKLYEGLFDDSEILKLNNLVSDLRAAGKRGQLQGQTFVISKRPMKGHGREMIQFGTPITDPLPEDEVPVGASKDTKVEPIPVLLQDAIERLLTEHVVSVKPDSAIVDVFNEGDHSNPHIWPQWLGRPVYVIFLTACEMSFGKAIAMDQPGHYRGALNLSLSPGSLIAMHGRSADFARHTINSTQKQRILITLAKSQPKSHRFQSPSSNWGGPSLRSPSHIRSGGAKHFGPVTTATGVLGQPNGLQPMFVAPGIAFTAPIALPPTSAPWPAAPPRHSPVPGTGVFLPSQGSGNASNMSNGKVEEEEKSNGGGGEQIQECNGSSLKEEEEEDDDEECEEGNSGGAV